MNSIKPLPRRKFHRFVFLAAGVYNITWGLYSVWDPQWLFLPENYEGESLDKLQSRA
jgi:hypothetical protein